jgi:hypothetical protein
MGLRAVPFLGNDIGFGAGPVGIFGQVTKLQRLLQRAADLAAAVIWAVETDLEK